MLPCSGLDLMLAGPVGSPELRISDSSKQDPLGGVCAAYLVGGKGVVAAGSSAVDARGSFDVLPGTQVCFGQSRLTSVVTSKDIYGAFHIGSCTETKVGDHVEQACPTVGARFVFSSAGLLKSVSALPIAR